MPHDLNEWQLELAGEVLFNFGTMTTDYPLSVQVEVGAPDLAIEDQRHPTSDGELMGRDLMGGFNLTFKVTTVPNPRETATEKIDGALDLISFMRAKWLNESSRRLPGQYVTLTNQHRGRMVYGRPRRSAPDYSQVRKGLAGCVLDFRSNNPYFYSAVEHAASFDNLTGWTPTGFTLPLTMPLTMGATIREDRVIDNNGDVPCWPLIEFHGPGSNMSFELLDPGWIVRVDGSLRYDEMMLIDTRPWARGATVNGNPANGRILGTQLEKCRVPAGTWEGRYKVNDPTGTAYAIVHWRDAFASL